MFQIYDGEIALIYRALVTNAVSPKLGYAKRLSENNTGTKNDSIADPEHSSWHVVQRQSNINFITRLKLSRIEAPVSNG